MHIHCTLSVFKKKLRTDFLIHCSLKNSQKFKTATLRKSKYSIRCGQHIPYNANEAKF